MTRTHSYSGKGCANLKPFTSSYPDSSNTEVGSNVRFKCRTGFTRLHKEQDTLKCVNNKGKMEWNGTADDCEINFCEDPEFPIPTAVLETIHPGMAPPPDQIVKQDNFTSVYFDETILRYKCKEGFIYNGTDYINLTCNAKTMEIGRGTWSPRNISCERKQFKLFL